MDATDFLEDELYDHVLRNLAYTSPTTVYSGLYTSATTDAGGGTEVTGGSYAREAVTFGAPTGGVGSNSVQVLFTEATATWGSIVNSAILDAVSAGNMLLHGVLSNGPIQIDSGSQFKFNIGDLTVTVT